MFKLYNNRNSLLFIIIFFFSTVTSNAQAPANDDACNATTLTVNNTCSYIGFSNQFATNSGGVPAPGCAGYAGGDVWFKVEVPCTGAIKVDLQAGSMTDGGMALYTGTCNNLTLLSCDDDGSTNPLMPQLSATNLTPLSTVWIRVWEVNNDNNGSFGICITDPTATPSTGACFGAQPFCTSTVYNFENNTNVPSLGGGGIYGCLGSTPNPVWYYMQVQNTGNIVINISQVNTNGTPIDVDFALWGPFTTLAGACNGLSASNNISCSFLPATSETAIIPNAQPGQFYMLLLTNFSGQPGTITFQLAPGSGGSTNCNIICTTTAGNSGPVCEGGTFNLTSTAVPNASYTWALPGQACFASTEQNPSNVPAPTAGTYEYTVTATTPTGTSCTSTTTVSVVAGPTATATTTSASCTGVNDGSLTVIPNPAGTYTYTLMPGNITQTNPTFTNLAAGTYSVSFDGGICQAMISNIVVGALSAPTATATTQPSSCTAASDGTITLTPVVPGTYTYVLSPGNISQTSPIFNVAAGTYSVTFTNAAGCQGSLNNIVVNAGNPPTGTAVTTPATCAGVNNGTLTVTPGGPAPYVYTLNPGNIVQNNNPVFTGLAANTYTVTFVNGLGCTGTISNIVLTNGAPLTGNAVTTNTSCSALNNGTITVTPQGTGPYTFTLNPGSITQSGNQFLNLAPGSYNITYTTSGGCTGTIPGNQVITAGPALTSTFTLNQPVCAGVNNGSITINPTSGTAPYSYVVTGPGGPYNQTVNIFNNLAPGTYTYTFTDNAGCTGSNTVTLTSNPPIVPSVNNTNPLCNSSSTGVISASATGGVGPYRYSIDGINYQTSNIFNAQNAGSYTLSVQDAVGCKADITFTLTDPAALSSSATSLPATCNGNDGTITVTANGGTAPYQYSINNGTSFQNNGSFTASAGNYNNIIIVKDANNCLATASTVVNYVDDMFLIAGRDTTICAEQPVPFNPQTNAGTSVFSWTPVEELNDPDIKNPVATPTATTDYSLTATYGLCSRTAGFRITVLNKPVAEAGPDVTICDNDSTILSGSATNLSGTVNFVWSPSSLVRDDSAAVTVAIPDSTQMYILTVTDNYGCNFSVTDSVLITMQPPVPAFAGNDTLAVLGVPHQLNGTGGVQYVWSPSSVLSSPFSPAPLATLTNDTKFTVVVTDIAGCVGYDTVFVKVYDGPAYYVPNAFSPNDDGLNDIFRAVPVGIAKTEWFRVFNRLGEMVFQTNQWLKGWDGTYRGKKQPMGVYVWIIKGTDRNGSVVERKGTVMLVQ